MGDLNRGYAAPAEATARQAGEPPDFMMYAATQLNRAAKVVERMAEVEDQPRVNQEAIIEMRLRLAAGYTELAAIQYSIPDEGYEDDGRR